MLFINLIVSANCKLASQLSSQLHRLLCLHLFVFGNFHVIYIESISNSGSVSSLYLQLRVGKACSYSKSLYPTIIQSFPSKFISIVINRIKDFQVQHQVKGTSESQPRHQFQLIQRQRSCKQSKPTQKRKENAHISEVMSPNSEIIFSTSISTELFERSNKLGPSTIKSTSIHLFVSD